MAWRSMTTALLLAGAAALAACTDETAARDAATIRSRVAEIQGEEARAAAPDDLASKASELCDGVSEADVARVEEQMRHLDGELVAFGPDEMRALQCSRSRRID